MELKFNLRNCVNDILPFKKRYFLQFAMSVVIEQDLTWEGMCTNHMGCLPTPRVRWKNCKTNTALQDFGLNQDIINQEIQILNRKAQSFAFHQIDCSHCWCCLIPVLFCIGFALIILLCYFKGGEGLIGTLLCLYILFSTCGCIYIMRCVISRQKRSWNDRLNHIENYIDKELNPRYKSYNILWKIIPKFITYGGNNGKVDLSYKIRYDNIKICPESHVSVHATTSNKHDVMVEEEVDDSEGAETKILLNLKIHKQKRTNQTNNMCIQDGYYKFECIDSEKVIEVSDNSTNIGAILQLYDARDSDNQIFYVERIDGDYYTIQCKHSGLYCNIIGAAKDNNRQVVQWSYHGLENQQFKFVNKNGGDFSIIVRHSNKALSVENGLYENGSKIVQCDINNGCEQIFNCKRLYV